MNRNTYVITAIVGLVLLGGASGALAGSACACAENGSDGGMLALGELSVPAQIAAGDQINVTVPVENPTGENVTENVTLRVDGRVVDIKEVTVAANATRDVSFQVDVGANQTRIRLTVATGADTETGLFRVEETEEALDLSRLEVTAEQAIDIAKNETSGTVVGLELASQTIEGNETLFWEVEVMTQDGTTQVVIVDAELGQVVEVQDENEEAEAAENDT